MSLSFDLYWSFRSPYSYLATGRIVKLARHPEIEVKLKVVLPIAVRTPEFFDQVNPLWPPYLIRDTMRIAEMEGIPYAWPQPDPVVQDYANRSIPKEQPYIWRLSRIGVLAAERGRGLELIDEVSRLLWSGAVKAWDQGDHLRDAVARAGLDLAELDAQAGDEAPRLDAVLEQHNEDLNAAGHWGVPTMVFDGEAFFGQDRLALLEWRLRQKGLTPLGGE